MYTVAMSSFDYIVIVLAIALAIFLVLAIALVVYLLKVVKQVRMITTKAESAIDSVQSAATVVTKNVAPAVVTKAVTGVLKKAMSDVMPAADKKSSSKKKKKK